LSISPALSLIVLRAGTALGAEGAPGEPASIPLLWWVAPAGALAALVFAYMFYKQMMRAPEGTEDMVRIAEHVRKGAWAYLRQQYKVVLVFFIVVSCALGVMAFGFKAQHWLVPFAFLTGGFFSGLAGYFGMRTATYASSRTTEGAKHSLNAALRIAFRSGAVMGLVVVGLGLLDICIWFLLCTKVFHLDLVETTVVMLCFGMGASSQALFARVGGGIFTKAADVGADLVGKVEAGIPEDDPRNPATIADNVGDNVGDVAGMGADLYESYCGSILATAALGCAAMQAEGTAMQAVLLPMLIAGIGIVFSVLGVYAVRSGEEATQQVLLKALSRGINLSAFLILVVSGVLVELILPGHRGLWGSIVAGLCAGVIIGKSTEYYTSDTYRPTRAIARQSSTGPATVIIHGISVGMFSTGIPTVTVCVGMLLAFGLPGGFTAPELGLYGVGLAAVGMLSTLGITLATDAYGPIADNAGGNAEMTHQPAYVRERTDALDALGNTTAATGKGFAIGSAALTALALLAAYVEEVRIGLARLVASTGSWDTIGRVIHGGKLEIKGISRPFDVSSVDLSASYEQIKAAVSEAVFSKLSLADFMAHYEVTLMNPKVLVGIFIGACLTFVFCSLTMQAVGRAAGRMVKEVRRQFRQIPGLMEGKADPDYESCVEISTRGAQREMIVPSLLALVVPVTVGLVLGVPGVLGSLMGTLTAGFVLAVMMANAGGAWDNAKKYIEKGVFDEQMFAPKELVEKAKAAEGAVIENDTLVIVDDGSNGELLGSLADGMEEGEDFAPVIVKRVKGSYQHKASVVGDTVGDPFKDTSGPSLNILIKLISMVSVVFAGMTVKFAPQIGKLLGIWR